MEEGKEWVKLVGVEKPVLMTRVRTNFSGFRSQPERTDHRAVDLVRRLKHRSRSNFFYVTKPRTPMAYMEFVICNSYQPPLSSRSTSPTIPRAPVQEDDRRRMSGDESKKAKIFYGPNPCLAKPRRRRRMMVHLSDSDDEYNQAEERKQQRSVARETDSGKKRKRKSGGESSKKVQKKKIVAGEDPAPPMPQCTVEAIAKKGGHGVRLILQKNLFSSDLRKSQSRLSIPINQLEDTLFLTEGEKDQAARRSGDNRIEGLSVQVVEPGCETATMVLRRWDLNNSSSYVLTHTWHSVVLARNDLKMGDIVQVWFFRDQHERPCFALVKLPPKPRSD